MKFLNSLFLLVPILFLGCISQDDTVYRDVDRTKVEFENETAGRIFYETLSKLPRLNAQESKSEVSIPVVFEVKRRTVRGDNFAFNDAVTRCDTNRDGKVTETEAKIFAQLHVAKKSH